MKRKSELYQTQKNDEKNNKKQNFSNSEDEKTCNNTTIVKLSEIEHVLYAGDLYVGQSIHTKSPEVQRFVYNPDINLMEYKTCQYPHGLLKIFDEALVNAADNITNGGTNKINVFIDRINTTITVTNNGSVFKIEETKHKSSVKDQEYAYQPEVAFFQFRTSSAYLKKKRITGGRFGLGSCLISIFSEWCCIEMCDGVMYYKQTSRNHMNLIEPPIIKQCSTKQKDKPFISITFKPDLSLFYPKEQKVLKFEDTIYNMFVTRVYDIAGTTPEKVKVFLDNKRLPITNFKSYVKMFLPSELSKQLDEDKKTVIIGYYQTDRWEVCGIKNPWSFACSVSFVNNINTYNGGEHVKFIQKQFYNFCLGKLKSIDQRRVDQSVMIFVNSVIEDPSYSNQSKEILLTSPSKFGSECVLPSSFFNFVTKSGIIEELKQNLEKKDMVIARKNINAGKNKSVSDIVKLRDARYAGTKKSPLCTLFIVEGDSAFKLAEVGLTVLGSEYYGAMPIKGVLCNADKFSVQEISKKEQFVNICRAIGLEVGKDIPPSKLRYGKVVLLFDADPDGIHIQALFIYMIYKYWPGLLQEYDFIDIMITPIVVATKNRHNPNSEQLSSQMTTNQRIPFYTQYSFREWMSKNESSKHLWNLKYYKGLGTSTTKEGKQYFQNFSSLIRSFEKVKDEGIKDLKMALEGNQSGARKLWLKQYDENDVIPLEKLKKISMSDFINKGLKHFSYYSILRSIPTFEDGLTLAQRKCLYVLLKKNITKEIKVSILKSEIDKDTNYHHGTDNLSTTIVKMAQTFPGKQNINLFVPCGQFGSRTDNGAEFSADRYIFTHLNEITRLIFRKEDDDILIIREDENKKIEPMYFLPIIPIVLCNGTSGVATAYKSSIPCYKPEDVIQCIRFIIEHGISRFMECDEKISLSPWYHKHFSIIEEKEKYSGNFISKGIIEQTEKGKWIITELPIGCSRNNYKKVLDGMIKSNKIEEFYENHKVETIQFEIVMNETQEECLLKSNDILKYMKLVSSYTSCLNLLNSSSKDDQIHIQTFASVKEIMKQFFNFRLSMYECRRQHIIKSLQNEIPYLNSKLKFIQYIIEGKIILGRSKTQICDSLTELGIEDKYFDSLLKLSVNSFVKEKVDSLRHEIEEKNKKIVLYQNTQPESLWLNELNELETFLPKFYQNRIETE
jgi:DNA topoisomerase II